MFTPVSLIRFEHLLSTLEPVQRYTVHRIISYSQCLQTGIPIHCKTYYHLQSTLMAYRY